ncbi:methyl-accepting chemotaxis protein [Thiomicrorhabdus sp. ZW0627]|uniref:methyl-accepting chemotaxis protein n=1 Tax=Thiomicrorhabdus sp. ZW0627 TaxID=3039774 RepID=UPI0024372258|nr:methyl-accepting chemotaxis protein [Thiomicrorhabdus sp. ZW0627]MDG6774383.1 methyl-accepting chemotaxis protein [Thiomicrorhabdus sp. ZW0627]
MFCNNYKDKIRQIESELQHDQSILSALNRVMAVIEFDLHGQILVANDNFLSTLGYTADEIIGQHHRLFVKPDYAASSEYEDFWAKLRRGEYQAGRIERLHKNGRVLFLEASYNPILNSDGQVTKIVKFATDITAQVTKEREAQSQIDAINRAMAVIEFDLEGNILHANDNFLQAMGYRLDEIVGHHHRMFVTPEYRDSAEYRQLWKDLATGKYFSGTIKRLDKRGNAIWLEASYNPIFDSEGQVYKVVKYGTDVGNNANMKLLQNVVEDAASVLTGFAQGDLTVRMGQHLKPDEESLFRDAVDSLTSATVHMADRLGEVIENASAAATIVTQATAEVSESAENLNQRLNEQAVAVEETNQTMLKMNEAVEANAENAQQASQVAAQVQQKSQQGTQVMEETIQAMHAIQKSSQEIAEIITLIDGIAFQTNLLALNAAVEAARAGDHGRGFAVVAGEVRALAQKSAEAAKNIKTLIEVTVERVNHGNTLATNSGEVLEEINKAVFSVSDMIEQIAQASTQQFEGIRQVHLAVDQIDETTQQNAILIEETANSSKSLSEQALILHKEMTYFKVD